MELRQRRIQGESETKSGINTVSGMKNSPQQKEQNDEGKGRGIRHRGGTGRKTCTGIIGAPTEKIEEEGRAGDREKRGKQGQSGNCLVKKR